MRKHILQAHRILMRIESEGAYSNMAFYGENASDMATLLVYGVLENKIRLEYIIDSLTAKKPQRAVYMLLRIGAYALENLSDVPKFAIVSECVETAKSLGKSGAGGFINAVLKKIARGDYNLPIESDGNYLSVKYSKPQWFIDKLTKQYGYDTMRDIIEEKSDRLEHIRVNVRLADVNDIFDELKNDSNPCRMSDVGGIVARETDKVKVMFSEGRVTFQSASSMVAVQALGLDKDNNLLDICSAPGGKAVYASELCKSVVACDLHPHRVELIEKYAKRMRADNIVAVKQDAVKFNPKWENRFDRVLVDAPCSCFGTFLKHPDVFDSHGECDIPKISETQTKILKNASRYVKKGGILVYSTCTLFDEENGSVVRGLVDNGGFALEHISAIENIESGKYKDNDGTVQILPHGEYDGFYVARLRKL